MTRLTVSSRDLLASLPDEAKQLFALHERQSFDLSLEWFDLLVRTALPSEDRLHLRLLTDEQTGRIRLIAPFRAQRGRRTLMALGNYYTSRYEFISGTDPDLETMRACGSALRAEQPAWTTLRLQPLLKDSSHYTTLIKALHQSGWHVHEYYCFGNWFLPVETTDYSDYFSQRPSRLRHTLERKRRQFEHLQGRFEILTGGGPRLDAAIEDYERIYAASWKRPEPYPDFVPGLIRLCAARGWLRLGLAYLDQEAIAAQIWILHHRRAAIYKLAYDQRFANYSVGSLLTDRLMREAIEVDRVREVDYLIGDEVYKGDWMTHRREYWGLLAFNPSTLAGRVGDLNQTFRKTLKRWVARRGLLK